MGKSEPIRAKRRYPDAPLVGVGVVIFNPHGEVLLVQRGRPPRQGEWSLPGGLIDLGESLAAAAQREVWEECAIEIDLGGLIAPFELTMRDATGRLEYHYVILDYWATYRRGVALAQDDAAAVMWTDVSVLDTVLLSDDTRRMILHGYALWQAAGT